MPKGRCCEWHDRLPEAFDDPDAKPEWGYIECGLAGMGTPSVCCRKCDQYDWFANKRGVQPYLIKDIMALPLEERP